MENFQTSQAREGLSDKGRPKSACKYSDEQPHKRSNNRKLQEAIKHLDLELLQQLPERQTSRGTEG
jgi:hypothetical protein